MKKLYRKWHAQCINFVVSALIIFCIFQNGFAQEVPSKEVALTIDDLPFVGQTQNDPEKYRREHRRFMEILATLKQDQVPATGFVIAGAIERDQGEWLKQFKAADNIIGNHSYSHKSLGRTPVNIYIEDVKKADGVLEPLMSSPKYYRYPYLSEGFGTEKYDKFRHYLFSNNYVVAPATIISHDTRFNLNLLNIPWQKRKDYIDTYRHRYLDYVWSQTVKAEKKAEKIVHRPIKQILLIHMNTLNSYFLGDLITLYHHHGYKFITLPEALTDPYYKNHKEEHPVMGGDK